MMPNLCLTVYDRYDLLKKFFDSIDYPIREICLIVNSEKHIDDNILSYIKNKFPQTDIIIPKFNMGVSASWNFFINRYINRDGEVYISQDDIQFNGGSLARSVELINGELNHSDCILGFSWGFFNLKKSGFEKLGYFDENFYPAYYEDADYCYRVKLHNDISSEKFSFGFLDRNWFIHEGSASRLNEDRTKYNTEIGIAANYYVEKWGGFQNSEKFINPYNSNILSYKNWISNYKLRHETEFRII